MKIGTRVERYWACTDEGTVILCSPQLVGTVIAVDLNEDDYPTSYSVRWDNGQISHDEGSLEDVTPKLFVNIYLCDREYGGGEEGGWWYTTLSPEQEECREFDTQAEAEAYVATAQAWCDEENSQRRSDISSVLSEGRFQVELEAWPAEPSPSRRPYYC